MRFLLVINSNRGHITYLCEISRIEVENRQFRLEYSDCKP